MKTKHLFLIFSMILFLFCSKKEQVEKPQQAISHAEAKILEDEYVRTRANPLDSILNSNGIINGKDARYFWHDLKGFKRYIAYVEKEAKKKGITSGLGLRIYLGAYPNDPKYHQPGGATIFFIPTYKKKPVVGQGPQDQLLDEVIKGVAGFNYGIKSTFQDQDSKRPKHAISYKDARILQKEYINTRGRFLNRTLQNRGILNHEGVRDVWYDLEVIKQYIAYYEQEADNKGIRGVLGFRVYLGAYPDEPKYHQPGCLTVFFLPARVRNPLTGNLIYAHQGEDEPTEDVDGLNFGTGGKPPGEVND